MIGRRAILTAAAALPVISSRGALASPERSNLRFAVTRDGSWIGQHTIRFRQDSTTLEVEIDVDIVVRLGPIVLYRYALKGREVWRNGAFVSLDSATNDDGTQSRVKAMRTTNHVAVEASAASRVLFSPDAIPLTHWNRLCMERPLFDPQSGEAIESSVLLRGEDNVPLADGSAIRATRYSLVGKVALDDWYDTGHHWTALRAPGRDGSTIEYRRAS